MALHAAMSHVVYHRKLQDTISCVLLLLSAGVVQLTMLVS